MNISSALGSVDSRSRLQKKSVDQFTGLPENTHDDVGGSARLPGDLPDAIDRFSMVPANTPDNIGGRSALFGNLPDGVDSFSGLPEKMPGNIDPLSRLHEAQPDAVAGISSAWRKAIDGWNCVVAGRRMPGGMGKGVWGLSGVYR